MTKKKLPKVPRMRRQFRDTIFGVDVIYELHKPPKMEVPKDPDPVFWMKNHPDSKKTFRRWFVFKNKDDFEKFFMEYGAVPELKDWHDGYDNDWVLADDGGVCEIIKRGKMGKKSAYVRTIVGTFIVNPKTREKMPFFMDTDFHKHACRSRFSGVKYYNLEDFIKKRKKITNKEKIFAYDVAHGVKMTEAYKDCYPQDVSDRKILEKRALLLVGQERIRKEVAKNLEDIYKERGIDHEYLIDRMKELVEKMEKEKDYRGAMEGIKTLAKNIATFEAPTIKDPTQGMFGMIQQTFALDGDVKDIEEAKQIEGDKDE